MKKYLILAFIALAAEAQITVTNLADNITQVTVNNDWLVRPDHFTSLFWARSTTGPWTNAAWQQTGYNAHQVIYRFTNEPSVFLQTVSWPIVWPVLP